MLRLLGLDGVILKIAIGAAALAALGALVYAVTAWWAATKADWKAIGRLECQTEVAKAYNRGLEDNLEQVRKAVLEAAAQRRANEDLREALEARAQALEEDLNAQAAEMARLEGQICVPGEELRVPPEVVEILNRGGRP